MALYVRFPWWLFWVVSRKKWKQLEQRSKVFGHAGETFTVLEIFGYRLVRHMWVKEKPRRRAVSPERTEGL